MATDKTPVHKRIQRAENSAATWKQKATDRREENERLQERLEGLEKKFLQFHILLTEANNRANALEKQVESLSENLEEANQIIVKQQEEIAELKKKSSLQNGPKPFKHRFTSGVINIAVELFKKGLGYRQIENVFKVLQPNLNHTKAPSDSVIRQWIMRTGFFKIHNSLPIGEWMLLGDVTIDIGKIKCLVTCGVNLDKLREREDYIIAHSDLEIVGIHPTEQSNGEFVSRAFQEGINKLGGYDAVKGLLIDQGSDVKKGAGLLQEANKQLKVFFDISHKLSLVLEKDFINDPKWNDYTAKLTRTKQLVQQTELAALQPPNQRSKARFMNISLYINWPDRILQSKSAGYLDEIPNERYQEYFGWLDQYVPSLVIWGQKVGVVETIKSVIREHGLSEDSYNYLLTIVAQMPLEEKTEAFICDTFSSLYEEVKKLDEDQTLPAFTESLESVFGSYKYHTAKGGQGITGNVLTIGTLVGNSLNSEELCKALEKTSVRKMLAWVESKVGDTLSKIRNRLFNGIKWTKFDSQSDMAAAA
jgi:hypothetical protein